MEHAKLDSLMTDTASSGTKWHIQTSTPANSKTCFIPPPPQLKHIMKIAVLWR